MSPLEAHRDQVEGWIAKGFQATTIQGLLRRKHGYARSYSSVRRVLAKLRGPARKATMRLGFDPGEALQVDFGSGSRLPGPETCELRKT